MEEEDLVVPSHYAMTLEGKGYHLVLSLVLSQVLPREGVPQPGQEYPYPRQRCHPRTGYGVGGKVSCSFPQEDLFIYFRTYLYLYARRKVTFIASAR